MSDCLLVCERMVRQHDPDRFFSALFAPAASRGFLYALYAFNHELAHIAETVSEPMMADIRRQWWREAIDDAAAGQLRRHDVVQALGLVLAQTALTPQHLHALIDARAQDDGDVHFATLAQLSAHADATSGAVMRNAACLLGFGSALDDMIGAAGIAYGLTGLLRALPFHAARGKLYLPGDLMAAAGLSHGTVLAGRGGKPLLALYRQLADIALGQLTAARAQRWPKASLPAVLPAALCAPYLRRMRAADFDPFRDRADLPLWRRQIALYLAAARGRI